MRDQWIEAGILRNDVKIGRRIDCGNPANVVRDVKVQGIWSCPGYLDVLGPLSQPLYAVRYLEGKLHLIRTYKYEQFEVIVIQKIKRTRLNTLEIYEYVIRFQRSPQLRCGDPREPDRRLGYFFDFPLALPSVALLAFLALRFFTAAAREVRFFAAVFNRSP